MGAPAFAASAQFEGPGAIGFGAGCDENDQSISSIAWLVGGGRKGVVLVLEPSMARRVCR